MNALYAIPSLAAALISLGVFSFIYITRPKHSHNVVWAHFSVALFLVAIGEFLSRMSGKNLLEALHWHTLTILGISLAVWLYLYFTLVYPTKLNFVRTRAGKVVLLVVLFIGLLFFANAFFRATSLMGQPGLPDVDMYQGEFYTLNGMYLALGGVLFVPSMAYLVVMVVVGTSILSWRYVKGDAHSKKPLAFIISGVVILISLAFSTDFILPRLSVHVIGLTSTGLALMGAIITYAIARRRLFIVKPGIEEIKLEPKKHFEKGYYYIILEDNMANPERSYGKFCEQVKAGIQGIIVTSGEPAVVREKYGLEKTPIVYITNKQAQGKGEEAITGNTIVASPSDLGNTLDIVVKFLSENRGAVILVDCLPNIIAENSKTSAQKHSLLDTVASLLKFMINSDAILLVPMEGTWVHVDDEMKVIKMNQLMRASNIWPILQLERLCNFCVEPLDRESGDGVVRILERLGKTEKFFTFFKYENGEISIKYSYRMKFTYQDMLHYFKLFVREIKPITRVDMAAVRKILDSYFVSLYEFDMEPGHGYLVFSSTPQQSFAIFTDFISRGYYGMYLSRTNPRAYQNIPEDIRSRIRLRWITDSGGGEHAVSPKLEYIRREIEDFFNENISPGRIVVLDNIEYLVKYNGSFDEVHLFITNLHDIITPKDGILVIPAARDMMSEKEKTTLTQEIAELDYSEEH